MIWEEMSTEQLETGDLVVEVPMVELSWGQRFAGSLLRLMGMVGVGVGGVQVLSIGAIYGLSGFRSSDGALACARTALIGSGVLTMGSLMMAFGAMIGGKAGLRDGKEFVWWVVLVVGRNLGVASCAGVAMGVVWALAEKDFLNVGVCVVVVILLLKLSVRASLAKDRMEERWEALQAFQGLARLKKEETLERRSR